MTEIADFLEAAEQTTVQDCPLDIRTGVYNRENVFLFLLVAPMEEVEEAQELLMSQRMVQRHR